MKSKFCPWRPAEETVEKRAIACRAHFLYIFKKKLQPIFLGGLPVKWGSLLTIIIESAGSGIGIGTGIGVGVGVGVPTKMLTGSVPMI